MDNKFSGFSFVCVHILLCICLDTIAAVNILLQPISFKSHVMQYIVIGNKLAERGHSVTMVLSPTYPEFNTLQEKCNFEVLGHAVQDLDWYTQPHKPSIQDFNQLDMYRYAVNDFKGFCSNLMNDKELLEILRKKKFAISLVDSVPLSRCLWVLPYRLDIPYVSFTVTFEAWLNRVPALPSVMPFQYASIHSEQMSFQERLHNLWMLIKWAYVSQDIPMLSDNFIKTLTPDKPFLSVSELAHKSELWLIDSDILLDYARPVMPNEIFVGGILTKAAEKLDNDLQLFMDAAHEGVIIVSFGGMDALPHDKLSIFLKAFDSVPQHVVLRTIHMDQIKNFSPRIKVMKWIPQNDLLGHKNTKLFLTHCGGNSQFQALYHAVPMIGFPAFADQPYNARRMAHHGYGVYLDISTLDSNNLIFWINEILNNNSSYRHNIESASALFHSRPEQPVDRIANSIEYASKYGGKHLKSHAAYNLAWYEYLMLDILALIALIITLIISCFCGLIWYCCRKHSLTEVKLKQS